MTTSHGETHRPRPRIDSAFVKALARTYRWQRMLERGECTSITELTAAEKIDRSHLCRVLRLTLLAPEIVEAVLDGRQSKGVTLSALIAGKGHVRTATNCDQWRPAALCDCRSYERLLTLIEDNPTFCGRRPRRALHLGSSTLRLQVLRASL